MIKWQGYLDLSHLFGTTTTDVVRVGLVVESVFAGEDAIPADFPNFEPKSSKSGDVVVLKDVFLWWREFVAEVVFVLLVLLLVEAAAVAVPTIADDTDDDEDGNCVDVAPIEVLKFELNDSIKGEGARSA